MPVPSASTARRASSSSPCDRQTYTPFPAASPSALITHGGRAIGSCAAVGTFAAVMTSFANDLEPSIIAAGALGPNTAMPAWRKTSATPATSGASGPTTTRSTSSVRARSRRPSPSSARIGWHSPRRAIPGLPGAACRSVSDGDCASFQASACSRPPEPTRRTLTAASLCRLDTGAVADDPRGMDAGSTRMFASAEAYDRYVGRYGPALSRAHISAADVKLDDTVLDVGCGPGPLTAALAALVTPERVGAVDPSP